MAIVGAVVSTLLGAAIASLAVGIGEVGLPMLVMAPIFVVASIFTSPLVFPVWATSMIVAHLIMRRVVARRSLADSLTP